MIKLRPLMEVPQVVHRSKRSEARPTTGSSICHDLSRLSTPSTPRGKAPFFGAEIYAKTGCNSHSPRKPWRVTCPKDCTCGARTARGKSKDDALPKLWMQWQAKTIASHEFPSMSEDTVEDLPLFDATGSSSLSLSKIFPVRRAKTLACGEKSLALKDERDGDGHRYRHKSNVRSPKIFLPRAKTTGQRELAQAAGELEEEQFAHTWALNRVVSEATEADSWDTRPRPERRASELLGFGVIISLAKKHGIPAQEVRQCADEFRTVDSDRDGKLSMQQFEILVRKRCDMTPGEQMPSTLAPTMQKAADQRGDGKVAFEDFLLWVWQCIFMEEMSATDSLERQQRNLARELGLDLPKLEYLRELFNDCDDDRSGFIEWPEFDQLVRSLLDAKEATDVSEALLRRYWSEASNTSSEQIGFPDFVRWYAKNFA